MALGLAFSVLVIAALVLVSLGLFPDQEAALYLTAVGLVLSLAAVALLLLVLSRRRPQTASDPPALRSTGDQRVSVIALLRPRRDFSR